MHADALIAAYRGRFPVLQKYEAVTWFDADGWKLAGNARTIGQRQTKETWKQFEVYLAAPDTAPVPEGYTGRPSTRRIAKRRCGKRTPCSRRGWMRPLRAGEWDPVQAGGAEAVRPTLEARGLKESLLQYLSTTYALTDEGAREALHRFLGDETRGCSVGRTCGSARRSPRLTPAGAGPAGVAARGASRRTRTRRRRSRG